MCEARSLAAGWRNLGDRLSRRLWLLQSEALCAEARRRTSLEDFGDPPIEPALSILVNSLELEADLHPLGRFLMRVHLRELLETRLRLAHTWSGQLEAAVIERPVFITGMPRSGSTFLHKLLAQDPDNRAPRVWEVMFPLPTKSTWPNKVVHACRRPRLACGGFDGLLRVRIQSTPCARGRRTSAWPSIVSYTLTSEEFVSTGRIPTYEAFLHAADLGPVYRWQKWFLQHLQLGCPNRRWVLKSPDHVYGLDKLLTVFPDAAIIQTHRNSVDVLKSQIQLTQVLEAIYARPVALDRLGMSEARKVKQISDYITRFRDAHRDAAEKFIDITYRELVSDPCLTPWKSCGGSTSDSIFPLRKPPPNGCGSSLQRVRFTRSPVASLTLA